MDLLILISIASTVLVLLLTLLYFRAKDDKTQKKGPQQQQQPQRPVPLRAQEGIPRRAQIARNQRLRTANALGAAGGPNAVNNRQQQQQQQQNDLLLANNNNNIDNVDDSDEDNARAIPDFGDEKMGAKKRAKLEAKAEKKNQREHELKIREDRKKQEAMQTENRRKLEEKERIEELQREEAERLAREERERKELEEYLKMKQAFSVEEEGYDDDDDGDGDDADNDAKNLLQAFIDYIKTNKVVYLEDLAIAFQLKTTAVIERIQTLQEQGILTGVIDDRGKFIYIAEEELEAVAKFIRQRGRVSITELAECSNKLVIVIPPTITEGSVV